MSSFFEPQGVSEVRSRIGSLKSRYGNVGMQAEDPYDEHMFGRSDSAKGLHNTTREFTGHLRRQYSHAERVLSDVERTMDLTEQDHMKVERTNAEQFDH